MAAQVEIQSGDVGGTVVGRLHFSPLSDSNNTSLIEIPSSNQSIISPESSKPLPGPKPLLSPKPFSLEKNPSIKPILAPKPQTKQRPESTRLAGYKPDLSGSPKSQPPAVVDKSRPVSTNLNRPAPTSFKTSSLNTGQTTKGVAQPFKPGPSPDTDRPSPVVPAERHKSGTSHLTKSPIKAPAAEWPGTTKNEEQDMKSSNGVTSITRAKSMGFLMQIDQEEKEKPKPEVAVPLRPQPRHSRSRPVSAIYFASTANTDSPAPAPRWGGRRPLSADLTSKFESIGLSLHHRSPAVKAKEKAPEDRLPLSEREQNLKGIPPEEDGAKFTASDQGNKKPEELGVRAVEENKCGVNVRRRTSQLFVPSPSPGAVDSGQGSDPHTGLQLVPETEPHLGVKELIKQLTEDTTQTQSPAEKPVLKPRPLPRNLTKRFSSENTPDPGGLNLREVADPLESSVEPQRRIDESPSFPCDQTMLVDTKDSQEQFTKTSLFEECEDRLAVDSSVKESGLSRDVQTVRASVFENVVERHSVLMMEEGKHVNMAKDATSPLNNEDATLVSAVYKEPVSPSSPLRVIHAFDTVQAVEGSKAVSENVPSAQWEDKAMTLRSRHSEGNRPKAENSGPARGDDAVLTLKEQRPRYLRVGALQKWTPAELNQEAGVDGEKLKESEKLTEVILENWRQRETEQEEVAAAPKRLKMLPPEEQLKPKATYFALTGQMHEPVSPVDVGRDVSVPLEDFSVRTGQWSSQRKSVPFARNPSLDEALGKSTLFQIESLMARSHKSDREIGSNLDRQMTEEALGSEKKKELKKEAEKQKGTMKELEKEKLRQLEIERQMHAEFARMKEMEMQREFERQRQKAFEKEKRELEENRRLLERQKHLDNEKKQELKGRQRELESERQRQLERERRKELEKEKQREIEKERLQELEREKRRMLEKERQQEQERQRELDKERQLLELQKERQKMEELEKIQLLEFQRRKQKEKERQQLIELEKQRLKEKTEREEADKMKLLAIQQEMDRLKVLERERERQREMEKERLKEIEREKQKEAERKRQRDLERERQKQLDIDRQELENQRMRQQELEKEKRRKEELEIFKEMEKRQLLEFEKQKQEQRERQAEELEKQRLKEKMQREEAEKMRQIAKLQEAERQRLKEKQKKEAQERRMLDSSPLKPKVVDLDSVLRDDMFSKTPTQRNDSAPRWKEASPRVQQSYKPAILDIDSFTSQTQTPQSKDVIPVSGIPGVEMLNVCRIQSATPEKDASQKVPSQPLMGFPSSTCASACQDPWELVSGELSVDNPVAGPPKKHNGSTLEQFLFRQEERLLAQQRNLSSSLSEQFHAPPFIRTEVQSASHPDGGSSNTAAEPSWLSREPELQDTRKELMPPRRSQGSQELSRMRSRSVSRRSVPLNNSVEGSLSRMRSRSAHREQDRQRWVQQKPSISGEEEKTDTLIHDTDSQYGTWETGLRTDDSLTPATPSSDSNLSPSPRKPTPSATPAEHTSLLFEPDSTDGRPPSLTSTPDAQPLPFPDAPTTLLDNSALRSRAQLGKKRGPRSRPSRPARQGAAQAVLAEEVGGATEDWRYRDASERQAEDRTNDSDAEEQPRGADLGPSGASQPQRIPLFPGLDPSALKAQLKKRGDSDNQADGPASSSSQLSHSPKSPFLARAARVLPPAGGRENGDEDSPQWLKELKSKKRLSQYEADN